MNPMDYWRSDESRRSQFLYVAFCEFASATLDFASGLEPILGRADPTRLNWASTSFYYSLVHLGRLLIFISVGDFPTEHHKLSKAFSPETQSLVHTNWLRKVLNDDGARDEISSTVGFNDLHRMWQRTVGDSAESQLRQFGVQLEAARQLRNENNYESLLIAHEYGHEWMTPVFRELALGMHRAAKMWLATLSKWVSEFLRKVDSDRDGICPQVASGFFGIYVEKRIIAPLREWYGNQIIVEITPLLIPFTTTNRRGISAEALNTLERNIDLGIFGVKHRLMSNFRKRVEQFKTFPVDVAAG